MTFISQNTPHARVMDPMALLVDGENLSAVYAEALLDIARQYGVPTVRRVYGKAEHIAGWEQEGYRLVPSRHGKNSADLLLCVEAMSLALREQFHTILIGSSDRDYAYLCENLRELGHEIVGIGERKAAGSFRKACSGFVEVASIDPVEESAKAAPNIPVAAIKPASQPALSPLDAKLKKNIGAAGVELVSLGNVMRGATVKAQTGCATWRQYLGRKPELFQVNGSKVFCLP